MSRKFTVERDGTAAGLRAVVLMTDIGHRCGYVGVPRWHPAYGLGYDHPLMRDVDVHGGLTYASAGEGTYPVDSRECITLGEQLRRVTWFGRVWCWLHGWRAQA